MYVKMEMINCTGILDRCVVSASEQAICMVIWACEYILLPLGLIWILYVLFKTPSHNSLKRQKV